MYLDHVFPIPSYIISPPIKSHFSQSSPVTFLYFAFLSTTELNQGFLQEYMRLVTRVRTASQWLHFPSFSNHWLHVDIHRDGALWANIICNWMSTFTRIVHITTSFEFNGSTDMPFQEEFAQDSIFSGSYILCKGWQRHPFTGVCSIVTCFRQFLTTHSYCCTIVFRSRL